MTFHKCFITLYSARFCVIDGDGDIRATAHSLEEIMDAKKHLGWGTIYRCDWDKRSFVLGEELK